MIKKVLLLLSVVMLSFSSNYAQSEIHIGMHVDPLIQFAVSPDIDANKGIGGGVHYGLIIDWHFNERFALNTGIGGSYNTFKLENQDLHTLNTSDEVMIANSISKLKLQYFEVPVNLKLLTNDINNYNVYALFGFTNRINIGARGTVKPGGDDDGKFKTKLNKDILLYDIPINVGVGTHWFIKDNLKAVFGIEYSHGLLDLTKYDESRVTLSTIKFRAGILF